MLNELAGKYREEGLVILAISNENQEILQQFREKHEIDYLYLVDDQDVSSTYGALGLPFGCLLDGEGTIVETFFGPKPRKVLEGRIRELLDLPPPT